MSERRRERSRPVLPTVAVALILLGLLFTLQGLGVIGGSFMSGSTTWAVIGPLLVVLGVAVLVLDRRRGRRRR